MLRYVGLRAIKYAFMIFVTTTITYFLSSAVFNPGGYIRANNPRMTETAIQAQLVAAGLDPTINVVERYFMWLGAVFTHWDWGNSPSGVPVASQFATKLTISLRLAVLSFILAAVLGIVLGVVAAIRQYKLSDRLATGYSYLSFIIPAPAIYLLIQFGAIQINNLTGQQIFYVTSPYEPGLEGWDLFVSSVTHLIVPTVALTLIGLANYQVTMRQMLLDNLNADYVRTARALGMPRGKAIRKHAVRVSMIPVAQQIAFGLPLLFTGLFFAERVFNWPGLGSWTLQALSQDDVNVSVTMACFGSAMFAIGAILADMITSIVDPRVRLNS